MQRLRWILPLILIVLLAAVLLSMRLATADEAESNGSPAKLAMPGPMHRVGPIVTNLDDPANENRSHIRLDIKLEYADEVTYDLLSAHEGRVKNEILSAARSFSADEIRGRQGMELLREAILKRLHHLFDSESVRGLYFLEFIIQ